MLSIFHVIHEIVRVVLIGYSFPSKAKEIFPVSSDTTRTVHHFARKDLLQRDDECLVFFRLSPFL